MQLKDAYLMTTQALCSVTYTRWRRTSTKSNFLEHIFIDSY